MAAARKTPTPVGGSPVQNVLLVARLGPRQTGFTFTASSLPGHLIQFVISGRVRQRCNGREYLLTPGTTIWYHEDEWVTGTVLQGPWLFYTVNFIAPCLPPPRFEARLFHPPCAATRQRFETLLRAWNDSRGPASSREFRVQAALLEILARLNRPAEQSVRMDPRARLWWEIETHLRQNLDRPLSMKTMQQWAHRSPATIARSCEYAVGVSPVRRLREVRMSLARGLVRNSDLTMKEIAERVGYARLHEFSRYYRKYHGVPPTEDRLAPVTLR